jgi:putative transposase
MPGTFTNLLYHLVFSTKQRLPLIQEDLADELYRYIGGIIRNEGGALLEIGGMPDHVHILLKMKPIGSVSDMLRDIKAGSSKWINESRRLSTGFNWQDGYSAFTVSESQVESVRRYIRNQHEHHRIAPFTEELLELLKRHGVAFDPRYVFE